MKANPNSALANNVNLAASFADETFAAVSSNSTTTSSVVTDGYKPAPFLIEPPKRVNCPEVAETFTARDLASVKEAAIKQIDKLLKFDREMTVAPSKIDSLKEFCEKIQDIKESFGSVAEKLSSIEQLHGQIRPTSASTRIDNIAVSLEIKLVNELVIGLNSEFEKIVGIKLEMRQIEKDASLKGGSIIRNVSECKKSIEAFLSALREDVGTGVEGAKLGKVDEYLALVVAHVENFENQEKEFEAKKRQHQEYVDRHNQSFEGAKSSIEAVGADSLDGFMAREAAVQFSDRFSQQTAKFETSSFDASPSFGSDDVRAIFAYKFPEKYAELTGGNQPKSEPVAAQAVLHAPAPVEVPSLVIPTLADVSIAQANIDSSDQIGTDGDASDTAIFSETRVGVDSKDMVDARVSAETKSESVEYSPELFEAMDRLSTIHLDLIEALDRGERRSYKNWLVSEEEENVEKQEKLDVIYREYDKKLGLVRATVKRNTSFLEQGEGEHDLGEAVRLAAATEALLETFRKETDAGDLSESEDTDIIDNLAKSLHAPRPVPTEEEKSVDVLNGVAVSNEPDGVVETFKLNGRPLPIRTISGLPENPDLMPSLNPPRAVEHKGVSEADLKLVPQADTDLIDRVMQAIPTWSKKQGGYEQLKERKFDLLGAIENEKHALLDMGNEKPTYLQSWFPKNFLKKVSENVEYAKERIAEFNKEVWSVVTRESTFLDKFVLNIRESFSGEHFTVTADNMNQWPTPLLKAAIPLKYMNRTPSFEQFVNQAKALCNTGDTVAQVKFVGPVTNGGGKSVFEIGRLDENGEVTEVLQIVSSRFGKAHLFVDRVDGTGLHYKGDIWSAQGETAIKLFLRKESDAFENRKPAIQAGDYYIPEATAEDKIRLAKTPARFVG